MLVPRSVCGEAQWVRRLSVGKPPHSLYSGARTMWNIMRWFREAIEFLVLEIALDAITGVITGAAPHNRSVNATFFISLLQSHASRGLRQSSGTIMEQR